MIKRMRKYFCSRVLWSWKDVVSSDMRLIWRRNDYFYLRQAAYARDYGEFPQTHLNGYCSLPSYDDELKSATKRADENGYRIRPVVYTAHAWAVHIRKHLRMKIAKLRRKFARPKIIEKPIKVSHHTHHDV